MNSIKVSEETLNSIKLGLNLVDGKEYRETLTGIAFIVSDILVKTLGPYASTTTIDDGVFTYATKDGWSVLNRLRFGSPVEETIFKFIKQISFALNSKVGDGTTTAVVAANHFIQRLQEEMDELRKESKKIIRQAELLDEIDRCRDTLIKELHSEERLKRITKTDKGYEDIYKVAYVSSNRNETISNLIKEIYDSTDNPNIHVTLTGDGGTYKEIQTGYKLDAKLLFAECFVNTEDKTCVLNDPSYIMVLDHNVTYSEHYGIVANLIAMASKNKKEVTIVAPYFDDVITNVLGMQIRNLYKNGQYANVRLVQLPMATQLQKNYASDLAVLVGGKVLNYGDIKVYQQLVKQERKKAGEDINDEFDEYKNLLNDQVYQSSFDVIEMNRGMTQKLTLSEKFILLENFARDTKTYADRFNEIDEAFKAAKAKADKTSNTLDKEYMAAHIRLVKFAGNTGIIHVGGETDLVKQCLKDSIDDAVLACRSAFENGYIRGLNIETISAAAKLHHEAEASGDKWGQIIYRLIYHTFCDTTKDVMRNKYLEDALTAYGKDATDLDDIDSSYTWTEDNLSMNEVIARCNEDNTCFDIVTEKFEAAGESLVNSVSTDCEIIKATTSILSLLLSSNQLLSINKLYDKKRGKAQILDEKREEGYAYASGAVKAIEGLIGKSEKAPDVMLTKDVIDPGFGIPIDRFLQETPV